MRVSGQTAEGSSVASQGTSRLRYHGQCRRGGSERYRILPRRWMPALVDLVLGRRLDPSSMFVVVNDPNSVAVGGVALATEADGAMRNIGLFINAVVKFAIVAFVLFLVEGINAVGISKPRLRPLNV